MNGAGTGITQHEAGHVVAALMTVNNQVDDRFTASVTLIDGRGAGHGNLLISSDHPLQAAFIFYAGPWAEARVQWGKPVHTLDDANDDGMSFRTLVAVAFDDASNFDGQSDGAQYAALAGTHPRIPNNEPYWSGELERVWSVIQVLADALRSRLSDPAEVEIGGGIRHSMRTAEMSGREMAALTRPLLEERGMWHRIA